MALIAGYPFQRPIQALPWSLLLLWQSRASAQDTAAGLDPDIPGQLLRLLGDQPFLFLFLALAVGVPLGRLKIRGVGLGPRPAGWRLRRCAQQHALHAGDLRGGRVHRPRGGLPSALCGIQHTAADRRLSRHDALLSLAERSTVSRLNALISRIFGQDKLCCCKCNQ